MEAYIPGITQSIGSMQASLPFILPEIALALAFIALVLADICLPKRLAGLIPVMGISSLLIVLWLSARQLNLDHTQPQSLFLGMLTLDRFAIILKLLTTASMVFIFILSIKDKQLSEHQKGINPYFCLLIVIQLAIHLMLMSSHLLLIYLSVEMVSVLSYLMVATLSSQKKSSEAALKYALFGSAASAVMLYGMSLLYGFTGCLSLHDAGFMTGLLQANTLAVSTALVLVLMGMAFKIALFPMHAWAFDAYQGAPLPIAAFLSVLPKAAGLALLMRFTAILMHAENAQSLWTSFHGSTLLALLACTSLLIGHVGALRQNNLKRLIAYASVGQSGFLMLGVVAHSVTGNAAMLYYLAAYAIANIGFFLVIARFSLLQETNNKADLAGLASKFPLLSACLLIFLCSLIGLPPLAGFLGKFLLFSAAMTAFQDSQNMAILLLIIISSVSTLVSLFYYLGIAYPIYFQQKPFFSPIISYKTNPFYLTLILLLTCLSLALALFPNILRSLIQI